MAYQQFEDRVLVPRVYGRTLNLPPIIVLIAVLAGAELMGITGVLLALPLTAAGRVFIDYTIANRRLPLMSTSVEQPFAPDMESVGQQEAGSERAAAPDRTQTGRGGNADPRRASARRGGSDA